MCVALPITKIPMPTSASVAKIIQKSILRKNRRSIIFYNSSFPGIRPAIAEKTLADKDLDFRKRQQEAREREEKSQKEQAYADEKKASCEKTRQYLRALESGVRIRQFDDAGKPSFMDDTLRAQELAKVRQNLQENCQQ